MPAYMSYGGRRRRLRFSRRGLSMRRRRRRYHRGRSRYGLSRSVKQGLPDSVFVKLKYGQALVFTGGGVANAQQWRANSCFDPDFTGIGHQPLYFDQYASLYERYMVYSTAITVTAQNDSGQTIMVAIWPAAVTTSPVSTTEDAIEQPYVKYKLVPEGAGGAVVVLHSSMSTRKMRGGAIMSDDWGAITTTNPSRLWFWNLFVASVNGLAGGDATLSIKLTQTVRFYKRLSVSRS